MSGTLLNIPLVKVATCNLAQQALNFRENTRRIKESIAIAAANGCKYRLGPELEIPGYSCEDHFYEMDTTTFSWMCLKDIMTTTIPGILCDIGMPIMHNGVLYNCRLFYTTIADTASSTSPVIAETLATPPSTPKYIPKIILIRPKLYLADDGNYREGRWFTGWSRDKIPVMERYTLPEDIQAITQQTDVAFGIGIVEAQGVTIASEVCEELFTPESPNILFGLEGVDILSNGSGSHFQLGKRNHRHELIKGATDRNGGVYMYSNQLGNDGGRLVFDGNGMIYQNGKLLAVGDHLSFHEVEVVEAVVNLNAVRTFRATTVSRNIQSAHHEVKVPRVFIKDIPGLEGFQFFDKEVSLSESVPKESAEVMSHYIPGAMMSDHEEISLAISRYLWDYIIRSGHGGFFLPLSGGVDSSSTALYIYMMCVKLVQILNDSEDRVLKKLISEAMFRIAEEANGSKMPKGPLGGFQYKKYQEYYKALSSASSPPEPNALTPRALMNALLHTANMPTKNNTAEIRNFAERLANALGSFHITSHIDGVFIEMKNIVNKTEKKTPDIATLLDCTKSANDNYPNTPADTFMNIPRFKKRDGDWQSNLAIQNIQARLRMVTAYYGSQILPSNRFNSEVLGPLWTHYKTVRDTITSSKGTQEPENEQFLAELIKNVEMNTIPLDLVSKYTEVLEFFGKTAGSNTFSDLHNTLLLGVRPSLPAFLVLASSNSDEALRGFYTKYDASSADVNPIGSLNKGFLKEFLQWCADTVQIHDKSFKQIGYQFNMLEDIINVTASPELTPADEDGNIQDDEVAIGMTYDDLRLLGELRKIHKLGPLGMFHKLLELKVKEFPTNSSWISVQLDVRKYREFISPLSVYNKVFIFFKQYAMNRHKMNILTNAIHLTSYSPDDNRFDHRPFLLNPFWTEQMKAIESLAKSMEKGWTTKYKDAYDTFVSLYPAANIVNLRNAEIEEAKNQKMTPLPTLDKEILFKANAELKNKETMESNETWSSIWQKRIDRLKGDKVGIIRVSHVLADLDIEMNKNKILKAKQTKEDVTTQLQENSQKIVDLKEILKGEKEKQIIEGNLRYKIPFLEVAVPVVNHEETKLRSNRHTYRRKRMNSRSYTRSN